MTGKEFLNQLSDLLFWDVDRDRVDPETNAAFLIIRIVERGSSQNVRSAWAYYGPDPIKKALLNAPSLSSKTIVFFANQFGLEKKQFRAHQRTKYWAS